MTAKIIDFAKKRNEKLAEKMLNTNTEELSSEELGEFTNILRQHIIENAEEVLPNSLDGHITVRINGLLYTIPMGDTEE